MEYDVNRNVHGSSGLGFGVRLLQLLEILMIPSGLRLARLQHMQHATRVLEVRLHCYQQWRRF